MNHKNSFVFGKMISSDPHMQDIFQIATQVAASNIPVLITGESGTGKGVLAQAIHEVSSRQSRAFVAENCAAVAENLLESELFGHISGAFTGAAKDRPGLLQQAHKGSVFLDEIGEMSLAMQAKLLRVLETKKVRPVGSETWQSSDFRLICATHRDLKEMISKNTFREDLFYRVRVVEIKIPPLRARPEDIILLFRHFLEQKSGNQKYDVSISAIQCLSNYHWPGNIRQLEHEVEKIIALKNDGNLIFPKDLSLDIAEKIDYSDSFELPLKKAIQSFEYQYIQKVIQTTRGNKSQAAGLLGISRRSLYNKLKEGKIFSSALPT